MPSLESLHPDCKRAVLRAHKRDQRTGSGDMMSLLAMVASDVWRTAITHEKARAAKAKMTPRERAMRKALEALTDSVLVYLRNLDEVMNLPNTPERSKLVALLANKLDMANDMVRYFTLGVDYQKDDKSQLNPKESALDEVFVIRVGTDADHLYLVRDVQHPGLWAIRKMLSPAIPASWTRKKEWELDELPLTRAFVKRARWSLMDARMEAERVLADPSQPMRL